MNREATALLWIIREQGSITVNRLLQYMLSRLRKDNLQAFQILTEGSEERLITQASEFLVDLITNLPSKGQASANMWTQFGMFYVFSGTANVLHPFDVQHMRVIVYEKPPTGREAFEEKLRKMLVSELGLGGSEG